MTVEPEFWRLTFEFDRGHMPAVERLLADHGVDAFEVQDSSTVSSVGPGQLRVVAYGDHAMSERLRRDFEARALRASLDVAPFEDTEWTERWKEFLSAVVIGERLVVRPPFRESPEPELPEIVVDPGLAFGTGGHETTRLALELALDVCVPNGVPTGGTIADVGCGSGVIAASLARLGCPEIHACDIDPVAIEVAQEVIDQNGVADQIQLSEGSVDSLVETYPVIVANIISEVLLRLAPSLDAKLQPGGTLILSGVLCEEKEQFLERFLTQFRGTVEKQCSEGDWMGLVVRHAG